MSDGHQPAAGGASAETILAALEAHAGGLGGVLQRLEQAGLASQVQSWISPGANQPVHPDHIAAALGTGPLAGVAARLGVNPEQAAAMVSQVMPQIVDHLTPHGQLPAGGLGALSGLGGLGGGLGSLLGRLWRVVRRRGRGRPSRQRPRRGRRASGLHGGLPGTPRPASRRPRAGRRGRGW